MRRRTRFAALTTAIALTAGSLLAAGTIAAWADEGLEFDPSLEDAVLPYGEITFFGTTDEPGFAVEVWRDGEDFVCEDLAPAVDGSWSCSTTGPYEPGTWNFLAVQTLGDPTIQQFDDIMLTVQLPVPQVTGPAQVPFGGLMSFTGQGALAGATIHVEITDPDVVGYECTAGPFGADGPWGCDIPATGLAAGQTVTATVTQSLGENDPQATTWQVYVGQVPPGSVEIGSPLDGQSIAWQSDPFLLLSGRAPLLGYSIEVEIDGDFVCSGAEVDVDGNWDCGTVGVPYAGAATFGERTVTAWLGGASTSIAIDLQVPAPGVDEESFSTVPDQEVIGIGGSGALEDFIVTARIQGSPSNSCTDTVVGGTWSCPLDLSGLDGGNYVIEFFQRPDPDPGPGVTSQLATAPLDHAGPLGPPSIGCQFIPGGVRVTPGTDVRVEYYSTHPIPGDTGYEPSLYGSCGGRPGIEDVGNELDYSLEQVCDSACTLSGLAPGLHNLAYQWHFECEGFCTEGVEDLYDYYFRVPATPVIQTAGATDTSVVLHGSGTPGDTVRVEAVSGGTKCTATVGGGGTWTCAFPRSATTLVRAVDIDAASGGMSHYSAVRSIPVALEPEEPAVPFFLLAWLLDFGDRLGELRPGETFEISSDGLPEGTTVEVWIFSEPRLLATAIADGGPMTIAATVPMDIEPGDHTVRLTATTPGGEHLMQEVPAKVLPAEVAKSTPGAQGDAAPDQVESGPRAAIRTDDRGHPVAPTALTGSIPTIAEVLGNPVVIAIAAGLAVALLALVALPSEILNSALSSNTDRFGRGYRAIQSAFERARDWFLRVTRSRALAALVLVAVVAFCHSFVDPRLGFDLASLRLWLSLAIAYFVLSYVASWVSARIIRAAWRTESWVSIEPSIVLFAILGVVVARMLEFTPGFLVGVAIGLELARATRRAKTGALLVQFGMVVGFSLLAWVGFSLFELAGGPSDFWSALAGDSLVAITAEGLTGAMIAAFPLRFLDGRDLWETSKALWAGVFLVVGTAFTLLVLPTATEGTEVADYATWLAVFCVFTLLALGVWWWLARAERRAEASGDDGDGEGDEGEPADGPPGDVARRNTTAARG